MARTLIATQILADAGADAVKTLTLSSPNTNDGNSIRWTPDTVLMIFNTDDADIGYLSMNAVADKDTGRFLEEAMLEAINPGQVKYFGPFQASGWRQGDGTIWFGVSSDGDPTKIKIAAIRIRKA